MADQMEDAAWHSLDLAVAQVSIRRAVTGGQPLREGPEGAVVPEAVVPPPGAATPLQDERMLEEERKQQQQAAEAPVEKALAIPEPRGIGMGDDDVLEHSDVFWNWRL